MKKFAIFAAIAAAMSLSLASCSQDEPAAATPVAKTEVSRFASRIETWAPAKFIVNQETANSWIFKDLKSRCKVEATYPTPAKFLVVDMQKSVNEQADVMDAMKENKPIIVMYANTAGQLINWCDNYVTRVPEFNNVKNMAADAYKSSIGSNDHVAAVINQNKVIVVNMDGGQNVEKTGGYIMTALKYFLGEKE